jgi:hypothetical protein
VIVIHSSVVVDAPVAAVWADLAGIGTHVEWMRDAVAIRVTSTGAIGTGSTFDVDTRIGPFRLTDRMLIVEWQPGEAMAVHHKGVVTGDGRFDLDGLQEGGTRLTWEERLRFPWWLGGFVGERIAAPMLRNLFRSNLHAFAERH